MNTDCITTTTTTKTRCQHAIKNMRSMLMHGEGHIFATGLTCPAWMPVSSSAGLPSQPAVCCRRTHEDDEDQDQDSTRRTARQLQHPGALPKGMLVGTPTGAESTCTAMTKRSVGPSKRATNKCEEGNGDCRETEEETEERETERVSTAARVQGIPHRPVQRMH